MIASLGCISITLLFLFIGFLADRLTEHNESDKLEPKLLWLPIIVFLTIYICGFLAAWTYYLTGGK
jgi:hypothetical protein